METNGNRLVEISALGEIASPSGGAKAYSISPEGIPAILPGIGGITYNVKIGDSAIQWEADHVEPCVSIRNKDTEENGALNLLACIANNAKTFS